MGSRSTFGAIFPPLLFCVFVFDVVVVRLRLGRVLLDMEGVGVPLRVLLSARPRDGWEASGMY